MSENSWSQKSNQKTNNSPRKGVNGPDEISLVKITTFQTTGTVKNCYRVYDPMALTRLVQESADWIVIGKGSNVLINPETTKKIILLAPELTKLKQHGAYWEVPAGAAAAVILNKTKAAGFSGLEIAAGIPTSIGGMVAMNFECWGEAISDYIEYITYMDEEGKLITQKKDNFIFNYRASSFSGSAKIIIAVGFIFKAADLTKINAKIKTNIQKRQEKQPLDAKTFGSIFKNPPQEFAAKLIEAAGCKGMQIGDAVISEKHANFLENKGSASFEDTLKLIATVEETVKNKTGIKLEREVKIIL